MNADARTELELAARETRAAIELLTVARGRIIRAHVAEPLSPGDIIAGGGLISAIGCAETAADRLEERVAKDSQPHAGAEAAA